MNDLVVEIQSKDSLLEKPSATVVKMIQNVSPNIVEDIDLYVLLHSYFFSPQNSDDAKRIEINLKNFLYKKGKDQKVSVAYLIDVLEGVKILIQEQDIHSAIEFDLYMSNQKKMFRQNLSESIRCCPGKFPHTKNI